MSTVKHLSKYIIIVIIWVIIAFFIARIQHDSYNLSASVLSLSEQDFFESKKRDAWYKKENQIFEVFLTNQIRNEWTLNISILYNPSTIERLLNDLKTNYHITNIEQNEWNLILTMDWYKNWDLTEWIFQIPYSWDSKDLTLEYIKSKNLDFAIWNLDNIENNKDH